MSRSNNRHDVPQDALARLVEALRVLPGVGPKSAQRMAYYLLQHDRVEQTLSFKGQYFVLMGRISPLDGMGPKEIHFDRLLDRIEKLEFGGPVREVVLATNFTSEGEATAHYIGEILKLKGIKATRIARGIPVGGELEYVDAGTLARALLDRRSMT